LWGHRSRSKGRFDPLEWALEALLGLLRTGAHDGPLHPRADGDGEPSGSTALPNNGMKLTGSAMASSRGPRSLSRCYADRSGTTGMSLRHISVVGFVLVWAVPLGATPPPVVIPVPPQDLRGQTLVIHDRGIVIDAPGREWTWLRYAGMDTFFAQRSPKDHAAYVFLGDRDRSPRGRLAAHVKASKEYFRSSGYRVADVQEDQVDLPFAGTDRVAVHAVSKTGLSLYQYSYLLPMGVTLQVTSPTRLSQTGSALGRHLAGEIASRHSAGDITMRCS
jgi:hypothetical protein